MGPSLLISSVARVSHTGGGARALRSTALINRRTQEPLFAAASARYVSSSSTSKYYTIDGASASSSAGINTSGLPITTTTTVTTSNYSSPIQRAPHHHHPLSLSTQRMQIRLPSLSASLLTLAAAGALTSYFTSSPSSLINTSARRLFSSSAANMSGSKAFLDAVAQRHSNYELKKSGLPIDDAKIKSIVEQAITTVPSSFNAQSTRLVVLLKDEHDKFWDFVLEVLQPHITDANRGHTEGRIAGFKAAYGSILFFENPDPVNELKKKFPQYEDRFGPWSEHTSAMHQLVLWVAFTAEGLGANLQHYNPLVDSKAKDEWKVPGDWSLKAQLVFGAKAGKEPEAKPRLPTNETVFFYGA